MMPDREKVVNGLKHCRGADCTGDKWYKCEYSGHGCIDALLEDALALLEAQEPRYPVCEHCGKQIDRINTSVFNCDGSDSEHQIPLTFDKETGCVVFETSQNWTGYELTDEERKEGIRCPNCGEYPFDKSVEIEFHEPVEVLMWTSKRIDDIQREYEAAIKMAEYCERYEPTYNADDGSM